MKLIKQTNKGEISIIEIFGELYCFAKGIIGFELAKKYADKYNAKIPTGNEMISFINSSQFKNILTK